MRTDEAWMVEKKDGGSHMYSLNDFKIHNTINIENGYMEGRYGAIPFIGELNMQNVNIVMDLSKFTYSKKYSRLTPK
ncbi:MAG: AAA family ATPase [Phocaeicola vulgatus]